MTNIALPIWLLAAMVATPSICLLGVAIGIVQKRRQARDAASEPSVSYSAFHPAVNTSFQNDLYALQIDAVFNAMLALIETERLKLKSLLYPALLNGDVSRVAQHRATTPVSPHTTGQETGIGLKIAERAGTGESMGDIAHALGISQSEVELAISMNSTVGEGEGSQHRLEAVA